MKAAIYGRVSTVDQNAESQLYDVRQLAAQRGFEVVEEYIDVGYSGARARRPALDRMLSDARHARFAVVMVWASDRLARSVKHFVEVLSELDHLGIAYVSYRENIDTQGALGRALMIIVAAIAELERSLIVERVKTGMRRARLEGRHIGRRPLDLDHVAIRRDRARGMSLGQLAQAYHISRTTVRRVLALAPKGVPQAEPQTQENRRPETAA
ncbi:MAG TPA: recombinase family protein [Candidatus Binatia bacterium]